MAKKATAKPVKVEAPKEDILEEVIPTTTTSSQDNSDPFDDDPFSSGVEGAVVPKRVEPEDELMEGVESDDEPDDFGQAFLEKDKEISETFLKKKVEEVVEEDGEIFEVNTNSKVISEYEEKITSLILENAKLKQELDSLPKLSPSTISDQFDQLYQTLKEGRATELLAAVQKDYLDLKYNSYTEKERKEIELHLKEFLRERFEGKVKAAKLIHKEETKGKT